MAKKVGVSIVVLSVLGVIFAITVFAFKYAYGAHVEVDRVEHRVTVNEVKVDNITLDLREIKDEQKSMDDKLDKILFEVKR